MALDAQQLIDAVDDINCAFIENADWFPSNSTKLGRLINAYEKAIALRPSVAALGGNDGEEIRFNLDVNNQRLEALILRYNELVSSGNRGSRSGGMRQNQLSRCGDRWEQTD